MMDHDDLCRYDDGKHECQCTLIREVVKRERLVYQESWRVNLPLIEKRNYERGLIDGAK